MNSKRPSSTTHRGSSSEAESGPAPRTTVVWLTVLTILMIGLCVILGVWIWPDSGAGPAVGNPDPTAGNSATGPRQVTDGKVPWGRLTYVPITLSPPLEYLSQASEVDSEQVAWHFRGTTPARLPDLLSEIGLSDSLRQKLLSLAESNPDIEGATIHPPREIVLGLSTEDRSALYALLAAFPDNLDQRRAFRFCGGSLDEWLGDSPLSPETRELIAPLVYEYGTFLFFADLRSVAPSLRSPDERLALIGALSKEATFLVRLELSEESDLETLVEYWGRGGRTNDVRPIVESVCRTGRSESVEISYLLPPFARRRLYTYEVLPVDQSPSRHGAHWTALNFFATEPDDRFGDPEQAIRALEANYYRIHANPRLGDLVVFYFGDDIVHSAVFIADDVLLTKNGAGPSRPWMLMKLEDMKCYYPRRTGLQHRFFRRKDL